MEQSIEKKIDGVISMTQFVPQTVLKKFILNLWEPLVSKWKMK